MTLHRPCVLHAYDDPCAHKRSKISCFFPAPLGALPGAGAAGVVPHTALLLLFFAISAMLILPLLAPAPELAVVPALEAHRSSKPKPAEAGLAALLEAGETIEDVLLAVRVGASGLEGASVVVESVGGRDAAAGAAGAGAAWKLQWELWISVALRAVLTSALLTHQSHRRMHRWVQPQAWKQQLEPLRWLELQERPLAHRRRS